VTLLGARTLRGDVSKPPAGCVVNWIGDSIAPTAQSYPGFGRQSGSVALQGLDYLAWAHLLSNGRILFGKVSGIPGQRADQMWARIDTDTLTWGGNFCGVITGTNDAVATHSGATFAADMRKICAAIVSRGQIPILTTLTPYVNQRMDIYRRFLIAYAADNGWPLVDFYSKLVDPTTGGYQASLDNGDGIHPNGAGRRIMGQALVDALTPYLPPWQPNLPMNNSVSTSINLAQNPMLTVDSNSDGVPEFWAKTGAGTVSLVTGDTNISGSALRLSDSASSGLTKVTQVITSAVGGHRIAFTGFVKSPGTVGATFSLTSNGTGPMTLSALSGLLGVGWVEPFSTWQRFYLEGMCPANATTLTLTLTSTSTGGPGLDSSVAQVGVFDLTACGI
jgi:hypothetical protein